MTAITINAAIPLDDDDDIVVLAGMAVGYMRVNPRLRWKKAEYKEAARLAAAQIVRRAVAGKKATVESTIR